MGNLVMHARQTPRDGLVSMVPGMDRSSQDRFEDRMASQYSSPLEYNLHLSERHRHSQVADITVLHATLALSRRVC